MCFAASRDRLHHFTLSASGGRSAEIPSADGTSGALGSRPGAVMQIGIVRDSSQRGSSAASGVCPASVGIWQVYPKSRATYVR